MEGIYKNSLDNLSGKSVAPDSHIPNLAASKLSILFLVLVRMYMNERIDRVRAKAKQCWLRGPWPLPSDRAMPGYGENLESKVNVSIKAGPSHSTTSPDRGCSRLSPTGPSRAIREFHISSAGASRTRAITTGSPALYLLSYRRAQFPYTPK